MSQYGRHPHYQASMLPEKSWGDLVESSNANNAPIGGATGRFGFPNGYPLNEGGGVVGSAGGAGGNSYLTTNANGNTSVHQNVHIPGQQHSPQQYWSGVRLPTASLATAYCQSPTSNPWINYQQRQLQQQQQQQQQQQHQMHSQLNVISPDNASHFVNQLTSPTSSSVPSQMTSWPKLPQQIAPSGDDDTSSSKHTDLHQQSPNYRQHFSSASFSQPSPVTSDPNSYNGLLAAAAAAESAATVATAAAALNQQVSTHQQSPNYGHHHNVVRPSMIPTVAQTSPLYHSSLELDMLRNFSSKAETFPSKILSGFPPQVPLSTSQIPKNLHPSPQHYFDSHSPRGSSLSNRNSNGESNVTNSNNTNSNGSNSAFCPPSQPPPPQSVPKSEAQISPNSNIRNSNTLYQSVKGNNLDVAKTMLTIKNYSSTSSPQDANDSIVSGQQTLNSSIYQQISPPANNNGPTKQPSPSNVVEAEQVDISDNSDSDNCPKDVSPNFTPPPNLCNTDDDRTIVKDDPDNDIGLSIVPSSESDSNNCKTPNALSIVETNLEDPTTEDNDDNNEVESSSPGAIIQKVCKNNLSPSDDQNLVSPTQQQQQPSTVEKIRHTFAQSSLDTPPMSKDSSPESNSTPSPLVSMSFSSGLTCPTTLNMPPASFSGLHSSASLLSGPQNSPLGPLGMVLQNVHGMSSQQGNVYTCHICRFSSTSKFHFNSHMNTHTDHKCKYCDYTSRTVGRLKRHMNDFHTHDDPVDNPTNVNQESQDSSGQMSQPPSPDDSIALMDQQVESVVSSVAEQGQHLGASMTKPITSNKPKTYRCKQCSYVATSKNEFWDHQRSHIKGDRVLACPRCSFVTEYKHHLEYHLRNHYGSKPFKCTKCNYSCVNKSMLNSHMKSHSNFYQYRCMDCTYATKYCHSLKLHLRKYGHTPATVVNPDGSPAEAVILDAFGNRRTSKVKKNGGGSTPTSMPAQSITSLLPSMTSPTLPTANPMSNPSLAPFVDFLKQQQQLATMVSIATIGAQLPTVPGSSLKSDDNSINNSNSNDNLYSPTQILKCKFCNFYTSDGNEVLIAHMMKHMYGLAETTAVTPGSNESGSSTPGDQFGSGNSMQIDNNQYCSTPRDEPRSGGGGYFGRTSPSQEVSQDSNSPASTSGGKISGDENAGVDQVVHSTSRRKGKAFKLDKIALRLQGRVSPTTPNYSTEQVIETSSMDVNVSGNDRGKSSGNRNNFSGSGKISSRSSDCGGNHNNVRTHKIQSQTRMLNRTESSMSLGNRPNVSQGGTSNVAGHSEEYPGGHTVQPTNIDWSNAYVCNYCEIAFKDCIMYTMHMGYHGYQEPFKCNMCGQVNDGRLAMFLHIARAPHS